MVPPSVACSRTDATCAPTKWRVAPSSAGAGIVDQSGASTVTSRLPFNCQSATSNLNKTMHGREIGSATHEFRYCCSAGPKLGSLFRDGEPHYTRVFRNICRGEFVLMGALETNAKRGALTARGIVMRKLPLLFAAAAVSGLALAATPSSATPLTGGLTSGSTVPQMDEGLVQKVHRWHCRKRWSRRLGWHRHRRACYDDDHYGFGVAPFFSFQFYDDDDDHRRGRKRFKRRRDRHD